MKGHDPKAVSQLAKKVWQAYVKAQPPEDRDSYVPWDNLSDDATQRGCRGVARMILSRERKAVKHETT